MTLGFFFLLVILAYGADRWRARGLDKKEEKAKEKIQIHRTALRQMAKKYGTLRILEAAQGNEADMTLENKERV